MPRRRIGFWYRLAAAICKPVLVTVIKRDWRGMDNMPADGGFITALNHNSYVDPFAYAHYQYNTGRVPRFLAKDGLFRKGFAGAVMRGTQQIPVYRESHDALSSFRAAIDAVRRGECVAFYPEGTLTRDPNLWPMVGKTGAARVALETKCPVIPVAQWGANYLLPPYAKKPNLLPRKTHHVLAGPPVDLSRFYDREMTTTLLKEATEVIMAAVTEQLEVLRGEKAPEDRYDPKQARKEQRRKAPAPETAQAGAEEETQLAADAAQVPDVATDTVREAAPSGEPSGSEGDAAADGAREAKGEQDTGNVAEADRRAATDDADESQGRDAGRDDATSGGDAVARTRSDAGALAHEGAAADGATKPTADAASDQADGIGTPATSGTVRGSTVSGEAAPRARVARQSGARDGVAKGEAARSGGTRRDDGAGAGA